MKRFSIKKILINDKLPERFADMMRNQSKEIIKNCRKLEVKNISENKNSKIIKPRRKKRFFNLFWEIFKEVFFLLQKPKFRIKLKSGLKKISRISSRNVWESMLNGDKKKDIENESMMITTTKRTLFLIKHFEDCNRAARSLKLQQEEQRRDVERAPRKEKSFNFFLFLSFFNPLHEIEHKWKQFIVYASSNHPESHSSNWEEKSQAEKERKKERQ